MKIYLIRHCQSEANVKRLYNCTISDDNGLTDIGKTEATKLGEFFSKTEIVKIYTSPFPRALQTAAAIATFQNIKPEIIENFKELECGEWNGKGEDEIMSRYPEAWKGWHYDPQNNPIPGGETLLEVQARVLPEFERIIKNHKEGNIVIVTHYCIFNVILCSLFSSLANFRSFDTHNGTVAEISMENVPRLKFYFVP